MTDGGDGARGTEVEGPGELDNDSLASSRADGSVAENGQQSSAASEHQSESDSDDEQTGATDSVLAEPTRSRLVKAQAATAELERGPITEYTTDRRSLAGAVRVQWGIRTTIFAIIVGLILAAILQAFSAPPAFGLAAIGLLLGIGLVWVVLAYRVWVYQIREDSLYLERGVVTHVRTIVPYVRIQHVDTSRSALERALGLSTLVVYTAGSRGADVSVPGLEPQEARDLQQRLKELAIEADGDDAL